MNSDFILKTAVVTGPTGAVGSALTELLLREGVKTYAVVRPGSSRRGNIPEGAIAVPCDMAEYNRLPELIKENADAFFNLAWTGTTGLGRNDMMSQTYNIRASLLAVHAAKELGCSVFVGTGSQAEHGLITGDITPDLPCFPTTGYGMAKLCAGQMTRAECEKLGIRHEWARILSVYGPNDGPRSAVSVLIRKLLAGETPETTAGEQIWDYLFSEDAARALYLMALRGRSGAVYPVGSGRAMTLRRYFEILRDTVNPQGEIAFGAVPYGKGQVMHLRADISSLRDDTGFEPLTDFETGIRITVDYIKSAKSKRDE